jgi:hypothetical protein
MYVQLLVKVTGRQVGQLAISFGGLMFKFLVIDRLVAIPALGLL